LFALHIQNQSSDLILQLLHNSSQVPQLMFDPSQQGREGQSIQHCI